MIIYELFTRIETKHTAKALVAQLGSFYFRTQDGEELISEKMNELNMYFEL